MGLNLVLVLLATVGSMLPMAVTFIPTTNVKSVAGKLTDNAELLSIAKKYSFRNAYRLHFDCYRICWVNFKKESKEKCYKMKEATCVEKKDFSYKRFIVYQISKFGVGKIVSSALGVPSEFVQAGLQSSALALQLAGSGAGAAVGAAGAAAGATTEAAGKAVEAAGAATGALVGAAGRAVGAAGAVAGAAGPLGGVAGTAVGAAGNAVEAAGNAVKGGAGAVGDAVGATGNLVKGGAGAATQALGGAAGGLRKGLSGVGGALRGGGGGN